MNLVLPFAYPPKIQNLVADSTSVAQFLVILIRSTRQTIA